MDSIKTLENTAPETTVVDPTTGQPNPKAEITFPKAKEMFDQFQKDNKGRSGKNAAIQRKRDGEQPYSAKKLKAAGQSWRSNRPTGFMNSLMKRLMPPYKQMIDQLTHLTYSHFPSATLGTEADEDKFRTRITNTIRAWQGHTELCDQIIDENIGFGYASAVCLNEYEWKPIMLRGDEALFPVGTPQESSKIQAFCVKKSLLVHEVMEILRDKDASKDAGWQVDNLIKKINVAQGEKEGLSTDDNQRAYQDLIRDNNLSASYTSSIKALKTGQLLAKSPDGKISHYIFDRDDGTPYYFKRDKFDSMEDVITVFSAELGDRTLQGSKGAGRALFNTHVSVEQARNLATDAFHMNGLMVLQRKSRDKGAGKSEGPTLSVNHPFAIIGADYEIMEKAEFKVDVEAFLALDEHATAQAEVQLGIFMPGAILDQTGEKRTASEVNYTASIDAQIRAGVLARFANQYFNMVDLMQRRICHPEILQVAKKVYDMVVEARKQQSDITVIYDSGLWDKLTAADSTDGFVYADLPMYLDPDAVECCFNMFEDGLSMKQIIVLSNSSSRSDVDDAIASQSGVLDLIVARYSADPAFNTTELKRRDVGSKLGAKAAEQLMDVDADPMSDVRQQQQQLMELASMLAGNPMPVGKADNDLRHLDVIGSRISPMLKDTTIAPLASSQTFLQFIVQHAEEHIQSALSKGIKQGELSESIAAVGKIKEVLMQTPQDTAIQQAIDSGAQPAAAVATVGAPPAADPALNAGDLITTPQSEVVPSLPNTPGATIAGVADPARPVAPRGVMP